MESTTSYTFPVQAGGIFYFPWHRHQIEGTDGFCFSVSSERHRDKQSLMLRARFLHLIMTHAWSGNRTRVGGVTIEHANHYTTALPVLCDCCGRHNYSPASYAMVFFLVLVSRLTQSVHIFLLRSSSISSDCLSTYS